MTNPKRSYKPKFKLETFRFHPDVLNPSRASVGLTKSPFQIHPDPARVVHDVLIYTSKETGWMLVDQEVLTAPVRINGIWCADLYECMKSNRQSMLFPVTRPLDPMASLNGLADTFHRVLKQARKGYVTVEADRERDCWDVATAPGRFAKPVWPDWGVEEMMEAIFTGHILDLERADALGLLSRKHRNGREIEESFD